MYDIAAENPDRWAVDELAATIDMVSRLADCLDTSDDDEDEGSDDDEDEFEAVADLAGRPEIGSLGLGVEAFVGRSGEDAWIGVGSVLDELWEDVVEELAEHLDWTGAGAATLEDYPSTSELAEVGGDDVLDPEELDDQDDEDSEDASDEALPRVTPGVRTIGGGTRIEASAAEVAAATEFWESVGILPVEIVVPEGAGVTLRCYVDDAARFLGRGGEVFLFDTPAALARFCAGTERHDLDEIASWPEAVDTEVLPLPGEQDRYDLTELSDVLGEVLDGATGLVAHQALLQPVEGIRDLAEYARLPRVDELLAPATTLGRAVARADREPTATIDFQDAAQLRAEWDEVVTQVGNSLVFRD